MKLARTLRLLTLCMVLCGGAPVLAEEINNFQTEIGINRDASLDVAENIYMDFGNIQRHGIFRIIPVQYERKNASYTVPLQVVKVTEQEHPVNYTSSRHDHDLVIQIGEADKTVSGKHLYQIQYKVKRALNFFENAPELYWNITGNEWPYKIAHATAIVHVPAGTPFAEIRAESFVGPPGATEHATSEVRGTDVIFTAPHALLPGEGLTIVVGLPAGTVVKPPWWAAMRDALVDWWPAYLIPALSFGTMYLLWWNTGRDQDSHHPIAVEWNPPTELTPAEVGTLVDESCDMQDIISTLIDLAARGYLKIQQVQTEKFLFFSTKDYLFVKTDPPNKETLLPHEEEFLNGLFGYNASTGRTSHLSDLKEQFYVHLPVMKNSIYETLTSKGLFLTNPETVRMQYLAMSILLAFVGLFALIKSTPYGIGLLIAAVVVACFSKAMPARSANGSKMTRQCLGFARFVRLAEKDRIRVLAKDDPTLFGRMLPYAMVLGAADQWAHAFEGLLTAPPDWYTPYGYGPNYNFSSRIFVNDLGNGMHTMQSTFASTPSSSAGSAGSGGSGFDGGSSGGGFGGGGGGSW